VSNKNLQHKTSSNNKLFVGLGLGILLSVGAFYMRNSVASILPFLMGVLAAVFTLILIVSILIYFFQEKLTQRWFGKSINIDSVLTDVQQQIYEVSDKFVETSFVGVDSEKKQNIKWFLPRIINYLLFSRIRNGGLRFLLVVLTSMGGLIGTLLLYNQNQLLASQNNLLSTQNDKIEQQIYLEETSIQNSLTSSFTNLMDKIDEEMKKSSNIKRELSSVLIGRVVALSQQLKPYQSLEKGELMEKKLSPLRGQLLLNIVKSNLSKNTYDKIFRSGADFSYADCSNYDLSDAYLKFAGLFGANFNNTILRNANVDSADLRQTNFNHAYLRGVNIGAAYSSNIETLRGARVETSWMNNLKQSKKASVDSWALDRLLKSYKQNTGTTMYMPLYDGTVDTLNFLTPIPCNPSNINRNIRIEDVVKHDKQNFINKIKKTKFDQNKTAIIFIDFTVNCNAELVLPEKFPDLENRWAYAVLYEALINCRCWYSFDQDYEIKLEFDIKNGEIKDIKFK
jgi:Pentapeptide repeats (8 copies)